MTIQTTEMGKTYRSVYAGSNSVSYQSPHDRGFAKQKKGILINNAEKIIKIVMNTRFKKTIGFHLECLNM